jgi:hypothetical protein
MENLTGKLLSASTNRNKIDGTIIGMQSLISYASRAIAATCQWAVPNASGAPESAIRDAIPLDSADAGGIHSPVARFNSLYTAGFVRRLR